MNAMLQDAIDAISRGDFDPGVGPLRERTRRRPAVYATLLMLLVHMDERDYELTGAATATMTLARLCSLTGTAIPTLERALETLEKSGRLTVQIEKRHPATFTFSRAKGSGAPSRRRSSDSATVALAL